MTDLAFDIAGNPRPEPGEIAFLTAKDGKRLRYGLFAATQRPFKGTLILLGGRNECIEKYFETIRDMTGRGFAVATLDWRGQGGSDRLLPDGHRGHIRSFSAYTDDLDQFFGDVLLPDCRGPFYLLAHSAGALIALNAAPSLANRVRRMVLLAPFLTYAGHALSMRTIGRLATLLTLLGRGSRYMAWGARPAGGTPFDQNRLTSDPVRYARNVLLYDTWPQLSLGGPTVSWVRAACKASERVQSREFLERLRVPMLFVTAGADRVVSSRSAESLARRLPSASLVTIDGARHEILQEADFFREQFFAAFDAFVPGSGTGD